MGELAGLYRTEFGLKVKLNVILCRRVNDSNQTLSSRRCESQPCVIGRNE